MPRRVFFSFHYQNDIWRVSQIRKAGITKDIRNQPFLDAASWEKKKTSGEQAVKAWIDRQLDSTSVTVVLIGEQTANRNYVKYEIRESHRRGNGLLGIRVHKIKDQRGATAIRGRNPFQFVTAIIEEPTFFGLFSSRIRKRLSDIYPVYDWVDDSGYENIGKWVEKAARKARR